MKVSIKKIFSLFFVVFLLSGAIYATSTVWSWVKDMYNQPSIKPYEEGSMKKFPIGSVSIKGIEISTDGEKHQKVTDFSWIASRNNPALAPKNPYLSTKESVKKGEYFYNAYCITCHGADGASKTPVALFRGGVLPINTILSQDPTITDGYLFYKITYGGVGDVGMPPFGYSIDKENRWHIVNYINERWKKK